MSSCDNTPALCAKGCGFYGSSANRNLCSKCYQVVVKEELALSESYTTSIASSLSKLSLCKENDHVPDYDSMAKNKPGRCFCCNKKIGLLGFACRCGGKFCDRHRFPEDHMCPFDYKAFGRAILARENPVKFNSMSLVNELTVNHTVINVRKSKSSDTSAGPFPLFDDKGLAGVAHTLREGKHTTPYSPSETVGSLVATPCTLGDCNAESVSLLPNEPVSTESPDCDLYHGKWVYDSTGPLYSNNSCPVLSQMQNCQGNGRPDKEYENWRWKPTDCDVPRFDSRKFLELMRGKTIAYIGDSVARNQMESLLCILWQVEVPNNRGNKRMQRYVFRSTSTKIIRIWSSCLVHKTSDPFDYAPKGLDKLHLDVPSKSFMNLIPNFDVIVISSGHWFTKRSAYILNNEIVGGQLWWPDKSRINKNNNIEAYGISVETILTALATHPNYTGLTILRSYSPDHYENGAWNTGGSCTGKVKPAGEVVENGFTDIMHEKQVMGFNNAIKKKTNKSKLRLMDITQAFGYRSDGHPGPYRSLDPYKITERGLDGRPPPQDCLHWCMPGPIDTWNELMFEEIRKEFEGPKKGLS